MCIDAKTIYVYVYEFKIIIIFHTQSEIRKL